MLVVVIDGDDGTIHDEDCVKFLAKKVSFYFLFSITCEDNTLYLLIRIGNHLSRFSDEKKEERMTLDDDTVCFIVH
jgi:hypothetical protein